MSMNLAPDSGYFSMRKSDQDTSSAFGIQTHESDGRTLRSTLTSPDAAELVSLYVEQIQADVRRLDTLLQGVEPTPVRVLLVAWRDNARAFGFEPLAIAATTAVAHLDVTMSLERSRAELEAVRELARRVQI
jgi:hypothetical protein